MQLRGQIRKLASSSSRGRGKWHVRQLEAEGTCGVATVQPTLQKDKRMETCYNASIVRSRQRLAQDRGPSHRKERRRHNQVPSEGAPWSQPSDQGPCLGLSKIDGGLLSEGARVPERSTG